LVISKLVTNFKACKIFIVWLFGELEYPKFIY
jgi:hypothetical protein